MWYSIHKHIGSPYITCIGKWGIQLAHFSSTKYDVCLKMWAFPGSISANTYMDCCSCTGSYVCTYILCGLMGSMEIKQYAWIWQHWVEWHPDQKFHFKIKFNLWDINWWCHKLSLVKLISQHSTWTCSITQKTRSGYRLVMNRLVKIILQALFWWIVKLKKKDSIVSW